MKKFTLIFLFIMLVAILLVSCGTVGDTSISENNNGQNTSSQSIETSGEDKHNEISEEIDIVLGSGPATGTWAPSAQLLAQIIERELPEINVTVTPSDGSVANILGTSSGQFDIAYALTLDIGSAIEAVGPFEGREPVNNLNGLIRLYSNYLQIAVREDSEIYAISDLRGKNFSPGPSGSGGEAAFNLLVLKAYDMTYDDFGKVEFFSFPDQADQFKDRHIDGLSQFTSGNAPFFQDLAITNNGIRLLPIGEEKFEVIQSINPGAEKATIPAGMYDIKEDVTTIAGGTVLVVREDFPENVGYEITKVILENKEDLVAGLALLEEISIETADQIPVMLLNSGAEKYYNEQK